MSLFGSTPARKSERTAPLPMAMAAVLATGALSGRAGEGTWESGGVRSGISAHTSGNRFIQTEGYATWNAPLCLDLGRDWSMQLQVDSSAGWLSGRGADGFVGGAGPALKFGLERLPVALVGGVSPTLLSRDSWGNKDFGIPFQFTSHAGIEIHLWSHFDIGYRFQHMSNGGLACHNAGLNLHLFSIGCAF